MFSLTSGGLMRDSKIDGFSKDGADAIALSIATFWKGRSAEGVRAWSYRLPTGDWGVRSNLVGGMPPSPARLEQRRRRLEFLG